jgi:hypothetical protein
MYKLLPNTPLTSEISQCVLRLSDNAFIPFDEANTDYQAYLKFLADGGQPLPAEEQV